MGQADWNTRMSSVVALNHIAAVAHIDASASDIFVLATEKLLAWWSEGRVLGLTRSSVWVTRMTRSAQPRQKR